jgi:anthranilate phosphoribosyltransferase
MVVSGEVPAGDAAAHLDELSTLGDNCVAEFYQERGFSVSTMSPRDFPVQPAQLADLAGGGREANAQIVRRLLRGEERGPRRDAVLLNAAAALFVADKARSLTEGWEQAGELIDSGKAMAKLEELTE